MNDRRKRFEVNGLHCGGCAEKIRTALLAVSGVKEASVSHESGAVDVNAEPGVDASVLIEAIESSGDYSATEIVASTESANTHPLGITAEEPAKESLYSLLM